MTKQSAPEDCATWREIHSQPDVWSAWGAVLDVSGLRHWIDQQAFDEVWFCGAGSSAYIGDIIEAGLPYHRKVRSIPSTDLVAHPQRYLGAVKPLVVNFGRSGNSAESIGSLNALDALAPDAPRLNITCNEAGQLANRDSSGPQKIVALPATSHDAGFAMTASFSTMLYTALALFDEPCNFQQRMNTLADQLRGLLPVFAVLGEKPERCVYVGAGALAFAARESALKVVELSAGKIPSLWDSTLGFRHGPKSFVTDNTAITVFLSPDTPANKYDADVVAELKQQFPNATLKTIGPDGDIDIAMPYGAAWAAPQCVVAAQLAAVIWAHDLGVNIDDPFVGLGTLSRVVADVTLYPVARRDR